MASLNINIPTDQVPVDPSDTDAQLVEKARGFLPAALDRHFSASAEVAWNEIEPEGNGTSFAIEKLKSQFIREAEATFRKDHSAANEEALFQRILEDLKKRRDSGR